jgi:hypothetical protein
MFFRRYFVQTHGLAMIVVTNYYTVIFQSKLDRNRGEDNF